MLLQEIEKHRNDLVEFLVYPEKMEVHHLVMLSPAAGCVLSFFIAVIPHYVRQICRYAIIAALVLTTGVGIIEATPDHGELFVGLNDVLREVAP
ncbi:hypothetical protein [Roseibium sp. RKSG952]|uniref:hypothetical protein n=1 Tax=Roseibium sp. RKSG952 TaxID=2529384 RepID=UPI0012BCDDA3|nr:hypothetical protein [Roseibium sp. RKSG952]MTH95988.1 hypothetical protein [Roseibium sp. RKSG952]